MKSYKYSYYLLLLVLLNGCFFQKDKGPDVSSVDINISIETFYKDLFSFEVDSLEQNLPFLQNKYGEYFERYCASIIGTGVPSSENFLKNMSTFLSYEYNQEVLDTISVIFKDLDKIDVEIENSFKHLKYYFPNVEIPDIYYHISGFNQSVALDSSWISVSIEKYLGKDCVFYEWLGTPVYLRKGMIPEKIAPDIIKAYAMSTYPFNSESDNLVNQMVYNGKILFFIKKMIPNISLNLLFDYTEDEVKWTRKHESKAWASLVEKKHLFSSDRTILQRYVGESPFTFYFGQESPGKMGNYFGYQIVSSYMKRNENVSIEELMTQNDGQYIFRHSQYRP